MKNANEQVILSGSLVELADFGTYKTATFLISVLDEPDSYGRIIEKEAGEAFHGTIVGFPIVAKLLCDEDGNPCDFRGHEMHISMDEDGNQQVRFGTQPIGSVTESWIEDREVTGYVGTKSCIMIKAKLWSSRYPEYCEVLESLMQKQQVQTSWELIVTEAVKTVKGKILKAFSFIGNALLGTHHTGAVPGAGLYEYAEAEACDGDELALAEALTRDVSNNEKEETQVEDNIVIPEVSEEETSTEPVAEPTVSEETAVEEMAALTTGDLYTKICRAAEIRIGKEGYIQYWFPEDHKAWFKCYGRGMSELDYVEIVYTVENDEITITEAREVTLTVSAAEFNAVLASRDEALLKANSKIQELSAEIEQLTPYKEAAELAAREKEAAELAERQNALAEYARKSGFIKEDELADGTDIAEMVKNVNEQGIKALIAERFMQSLDEKTASGETQTASIDTEVTQITLDDEDSAEEITNDDFMRHILQA